MVARKKIIANLKNVSHECIHNHYLKGGKPEKANSQGTDDHSCIPVLVVLFASSLLQIHVLRCRNVQCRDIVFIVSFHVVSYNYNTGIALSTLILLIKIKNLLNLHRVTYTPSRNQPLSLNRQRTQQYLVEIHFSRWVDLQGRCR
jgi:hypothetical protein